MTWGVRFGRIHHQSIRTTPDDTSTLTMAIPIMSPVLSVRECPVVAGDGGSIGTLVLSGVSVPEEVSMPVLAAVVVGT